MNLTNLTNPTNLSTRRSEIEEDADARRDPAAIAGRQGLRDQAEIDVAANACRPSLDHGELPQVAELQLAHGEDGVLVFVDMQIVTSLAGDVEPAEPGVDALDEARAVSRSHA